MQTCVAGQRPEPVVDSSAPESVSVSVSVSVVATPDSEEPSVTSVPVDPLVAGGAVVENVANVVGPEPVVVLAPVLPGAASPDEHASPRNPQTVTQRKRCIGPQDTSPESG